MKIPERCTCGEIIGVREYITYGGERNDDHIDYGEVEPNDRYGGEYEGQCYCERHYDEITAQGGVCLL
jgi:hypothetical protein